MNGKLIALLLGAGAALLLAGAREQEPSPGGSEGAAVGSTRTGSRRVKKVYLVEKSRTRRRGKRKKDSQGAAPVEAAPIAEQQAEPIEETPAVVETPGNTGENDTGEQSGEAN